MPQSEPFSEILTSDTEAPGLVTSLRSRLGFRVLAGTLFVCAAGCGSDGDVPVAGESEGIKIVADFTVRGAGRLLVPETTYQSERRCDSSTADCRVVIDADFPLRVYLLADEPDGLAPYLDPKQSVGCRYARWLNVLETSVKGRLGFFIDLEVEDGASCRFTFPSAGDEIPFAITLGPYASVALLPPRTAAQFCENLGPRPLTCPVELPADERVGMLVLVDRPDRVPEWDGRCWGDSDHPRRGWLAQVRGGSGCFVGLRAPDVSCTAVGRPRVTLSWQKGKPRTVDGSVFIDPSRFADDVLIVEASGRTSGWPHYAWRLHSPHGVHPMPVEGPRIELDALDCPPGSDCRLEVEVTDGCRSRMGQIFFFSG